MARKLLNQVRVATPCHVAWSEMQGDDRVRFCGQCKHNVYNLSEMSEREAEAFIRNATGRTCIRYYQRADGTVMTKDCPVGLAAVRRRLAIGLLAAATLCVSAFGLAMRPDRNRIAPRGNEPWAGPEKGFVGGEPEGPEPSLFDKAYGWLMAGETQPVEETRVVYGAMVTIPPPKPAAWWSITSGKP